MTEQCDFIVIGGGSGGIAAARRAAAHGANVTLIESASLGGTCVNVGCVPKKVMWNAAQINEAVHLARDYGFDVAQNGFDWHTLQQARDAYVGRLNDIYADNLEKSRVRLLRTAAQFIAPNRVEADGHTLEARHILVATGGRPIIPATANADLGISSDGFFQLTRQPMKPLIIGAGYIAVEVAGLLHGLGSKVTLLLRKDRLLRSFDQMLSDTLMQQMSASGVEILTNRAITEIVSKTRDSYAYRNDQGQLCGDYDCVLWAVGRRPNTDDLQLDAAGVKPNERGFIDTDGYQNTAVQGIYAVGDVTPRAPLTPVAIAAGRRLADRLFAGQSDALLDYNLIPSVIFSHPPIGTLGLTEAQARKQYGDADVTVYQTRFSNMRYALSEHKPPTAMKLITHGADQRVVGCHIIGDGADEMLQGFAVAIKMGATKSDFDNTVAIHPTAAEELVTL